MVKNYWRHPKVLRWNRQSSSRNAMQYTSPQIITVYPCPAADQPAADRPGLQAHPEGDGDQAHRAHRARRDHQVCRAVHAGRS